MLQTQLSNQYAQFGWNCIRKPFNFKHLYYSSKIINDKICQWRASYYLQNKNLNFIFFVSILWGSMDTTSCLIKGTYCHAGLRTVMGSAFCLLPCQELAVVEILQKSLNLCHLNWVARLSLMFPLSVKLYDLISSNLNRC